MAETDILEELNQLNVYVTDCRVYTICGCYNLRPIQV